MSENRLGQALDLLDKMGTYDNVSPERMDALDLVTETLRAFLPVVEAAVAWQDSGEHVCGVALSEAIEELQRRLPNE